MVVEFCSGCGFYRIAASIAEKMESNYPGQFFVELRPDAEQTGRIDVTVFPNHADKQNIDMTKGKLIHATHKGDDAPYKDWDAFLLKVDQALLE